ncbi:hypothetical protein CB1_000114018, partial [Camelus ferus]
PELHVPRPLTDRSGASPTPAWRLQPVLPGAKAHVAQEPRALGELASDLPCTVLVSHRRAFVADLLVLAPGCGRILQSAELGPSRGAQALPSGPGGGEVPSTLAVPLGRLAHAALLPAGQPFGWVASPPAASYFTCCRRHLGSPVLAGGDLALSRNPDILWVRCHAATRKLASAAPGLGSWDPGVHFLLLTPLQQSRGFKRLARELEKARLQLQEEVRQASGQLLEERKKREAHEALARRLQKRVLLLTKEASLLGAVQGAAHTWLVQCHTQDSPAPGPTPFSPKCCGSVESVQRQGLVQPRPPPMPPCPAADTLGLLREPSLLSGGGQDCSVPGKQHPVENAALLVSGAGQFQFSDLALELVLVRAVSTARLAPCPVGGGRGGCEGTPAWVCLLQELSQSTCDSLEVRVPVWERDGMRAILGSYDSELTPAEYSPQLTRRMREAEDMLQKAHAHSSEMEAQLSQALEELGAQKQRADMTRDLLLSTERSAVCSQYGKTQPPGVVLAEPELLFLPGPRSALALEAAPYGMVLPVKLQPLLAECSLCAAHTQCCIQTTLLQSFLQLGGSVWYPHPSELADFVLKIEELEGERRHLEEDKKMLEAQLERLTLQAISENTVTCRPREHSHCCDCHL